MFQKIKSSTATAAPVLPPGPYLEMKSTVDYYVYRLVVTHGIVVVWRRNPQSSEWMAYHASHWELPNDVVQARNQMTTSPRLPEFSRREVFAMGALTQTNYQDRMMKQLRPR